MSEQSAAEQRATERVSWWISGNLDDGEATCRRWESMVAEAVERITGEDDDGEDKDTVAYELAEELKTWLTEEQLSDVQTGLVSEFVSYMVACVDFQQLALDDIEEALKRHEAHTRA